MSVRRLILAAVLAVVPACGAGDPGPTTTCLTLVQVSPTGVIDLMQGDSLRLVASQQTCDAPPAALEWQSSQPQVAVVEPRGSDAAVVRATGAGISTITAYARIRGSILRAAVAVRITPRTPPAG